MLGGERGEEGVSGEGRGRHRTTLHVADLFLFDNAITMLDVVRRLEESWCGNERRLQKDDYIFMSGTTRRRLVTHAQKCVNKEYLFI